MVNVIIDMNIFCLVFFICVLFKIYIRLIIYIFGYFIYFLLFCFEENILLNLLKMIYFAIWLLGFVGEYQLLHLLIICPLSL